MRVNDLKTKSGVSLNKDFKLVVLSLVIVFSFALYTLKLFSMQVLEGEVYRQQSEDISSRVKTIPAQRGEIYDRNATVPMVVNTDSFAVDVIPGEIPQGKYDTVAAKLAEILDIDKKFIDSKIPDNVRKSYTAIEVKSSVPFSMISNIAENKNDLPGVSWRSKPLRSYVQTGSISHILGYVGDITREELKVMYNQGYTNTSIVGKTGIEKQYDSILQGVPGRESTTVDVRGRLLSDALTVTSPEMGKNLVLTIDSDIQTLAEKALGDRVGAAVVLKPSTGEILAMVSYPYFDSNLFSSENSSQEYAKMVNAANNPLLNRAINAAYPPASTFKVIMSAAMLAEQSMPAEKKVECTGFIRYGDRTFRCHIGVPGHGYMDLKNALAQSCNVYYWTLGRDYIGIDMIASYAQEFGLGRSLNIDLPSHSAGFIPTAQWKERRYHEKWLGGDTLSAAIGQGYTTVTPLHMANAIAMVVNEGVIYKPHLLKEIREPASGDVISEIKPEVLHQSNISQSVWRTVKDAMRHTVTNGTVQFPLKNKVVKIAGKSGTAEVAQYKNQWHSWFVAYAPYDGPVEDTIVTVVLVEALNVWEWWAPYATNIIMQGIFANQDYDQAVDSLGFRYLTRPVGRQE
ncbi:MAG: penicillin-binding protein 2 [Spirochaetaceae bacterium]|nr:penicillin-binding protein 2 [Spirochaetaceae bacterium]MBQ7367788.1 penicillin-binding protein 2 [Spirochaetaceae bacterium]MBQ8561243.1 penicillin-binding protein 2 [Spirochaetaceae bacterium]